MKDLPFLSQIESAKLIWDLLEGSTFATTDERDVTIEEDQGVLKQDRYPLRTSPQFIGPQIEDLLESLKTITIECNSSTYSRYQLLSLFFTRLSSSSYGQSVG